VDYLKELGVPVLRWPGGCFADDYHWRDGIGAQEKRPRRVNVNWGHYTEENGFGPHEFMEFCRLIGAEPYFAANLGAGSPQGFRDWVEYCNFPKGSTLSDERAANGSPEPFNVRYWGVGNELWGCGGHFQPEGAAAEYRRFATFARLIGGRNRAGIAPLYLVGCGPNGDDVRWTRGFMDTLAARGPMPNGYSMHYYEGGRRTPLEFAPDDMYTQFNLFPRVELAIVHQRSLLDGYDPNRQIGLILDEWGVWDQMIPREEQQRGRLWMQSTVRSAVAAALGLNIFNRQADKLFMLRSSSRIFVLSLTCGIRAQIFRMEVKIRAFLPAGIRGGEVMGRNSATGSPRRSITIMPPSEASRTSSEVWMWSSRIEVFLIMLRCSTGPPGRAEWLSTLDDFRTLAA